MTRFLIVAALVACKGDEPSTTDPSTTSGSLFGDGNDVTSRLEVTGSRSDGLDRPQDLAFNPEVPGELWVVNRKDDGMVIYDAAGSAEQTSTHVVDPYALHFMEQVSSIAFGAPIVPQGYNTEPALAFGTCQDSTNTYNDQGNPNYFMGPTLWTSDRDIFGVTNPEAVEFLTDMFGFPTDLGSHLDMLHESPECMGIAWDKKNVYWVFDGYHSSINRYDFQEDHGVGYDDHSDGIIDRWVEGEVSRVEGIVSHLAFDQESKLLYIADTGNNRIAVLDTKSGQQGDSLPRFEPGTEHHLWEGGDISTLVEGESLGMMAPAGLELIEGVLVVTDNGTGRIHAFDLDGNELDWAETGRAGQLAGVTGLTLDDLWIADDKKDEVLRLQK